jgi:hypothetical protein
MLVHQTTWDKIREHFSSEEKLEMREAVSGETVCPPGVILDGSKLSLELRAKLDKYNTRNP